MNINLFVITVCSLSLIIGIFIGAKYFKYYNKKQDKKILENAEEVLSGKRDNKIKIDGQEYEATKFIVKDKEDNETIIDLKGGGTQHGRRQEDSARIEEIPEQEVKDTEETCNSSGKKKRIARIRSIFSRTRRFG